MNKIKSNLLIIFTCLFATTAIAQPGLSVFTINTDDAAGYLKWLTESTPTFVDAWGDSVVSSGICSPISGGEDDGDHYVWNISPSMTATLEKPRLLAKFDEQVRDAIMKEFNLTNVNDVPRLSKVVINVGVGRYLDNQKLKQDIRDTVIATLTKISGQKPIEIKAKKSVSNFKVREGAPWIQRPRRLSTASA